MAWQRKAWSGKARHGMPWFGKVRHGFSNKTLEWLGRAWLGKQWFGTARFYWKNHVVWSGTPGCGWVR